MFVKSVVKFIMDFVLKDVHSALFQLKRLVDAIIWFVNVNMNFVGFAEENLVNIIIDYGTYWDVHVISLYIII